MLLRLSNMFCIVQPLLRGTSTGFGSCLSYQEVVIPFIFTSQLKAGEYSVPVIQWLLFQDLIFQYQCFADNKILSACNRKGLCHEVTKSLIIEHLEENNWTGQTYADRSRIEL